MGQTAHHITERSTELHLGLRRHKQMQTGGADDHTRHQLTQNCGELETDQKLSEVRAAMKTE